MTYRDETEALRARIDVLENELAEAKAAIADLRGTNAPAPPKQANGFWLAAPTKLLLERELDGEPTPERLDRLASLFRREYPLGIVTPSDRAFGFRQGTLDVSLTPIGGGRSRLRLYVDHSAFTMMPALLAMAMVFFAIAPVGSTLGPFAVLAMIPIAWPLCFLLLRKLWGARVNRYRVQATKLFETASEIASDRAAPVRIAAPEDISRIEETGEEEEGEEAEPRERRA